MRLALTFLLLTACAETTPGEAPPVERSSVERSAEENEPVELVPSVARSTGPLAAMHQQALRHGDRTEAAAMLERACDDGFVPSCLALADRLEAGDGVEPDAARAAELVEMACAEGSSLACDRMGH